MELYDSFTVSLPITIRRCRREDLPALEWLGLLASHRQTISATFERQEWGRAIMLVVEANGEPSGQAWIELDRENVDSTGVLWAVRILPCLQKLGIGSRLIALAERILRDRGFQTVELTVEKDNPGARRLYERLGYVEVGEVPGGRWPLARIPGEMPAAQWLFRKPLRPADAGEHPVSGRSEAEERS